MDYDRALAGFARVSAPDIGDAELAMRVAALAAAAKAEGLAGVWIDATPSLIYFCGLDLYASERLHGALIRADGRITYISPAFEEPKLSRMLRLPGEVAVWEEDEDPFALLSSLAEGPLGLDPAMPYGFAARLTPAARPVGDLIAAQRRIKSAAEIAILQTAMDASFAVQKAVHAGLREGIAASEVAAFIREAHKALGLAPLFAAVQFGEDTAYPHGGGADRRLAKGEMVLIDMGGRLSGYCSDITRTYVFGGATPRQRALWEAESRAQTATFAAAQLGAPCEAVDAAARAALEADGFGPGYAVPGLPHRTGHGLGLELHEEPFIVKGNATPLAPGMVFSIEPMLCVYGECGVRLEDIAYMTETGARFFNPPARDVDQPF